MRTLIFIVGGLVLLAACLGTAKLLSNGLADAMRTATLVFLVLWFLISAANMWVGVAKAGYSVTEELPIFLLLFGLPALVAIFVKWKVL
jgi:phosphate starvation-inducible membrane PsiE